MLKECLKSIDSYKSNYDIISCVYVVDNDSSDDSIEILNTMGLDNVNVELVANGTNRGFGAACNQGAALGASDHLLFLNPDTRLFPDSLRGPMVFMNQNPEVGVCGIQLIDENGDVARNTARFPTPFRIVGRSVGLDRIAPRLCPPHMMLEWDHQDTRRVDQVMGAFFWVRRADFESVGGFDEDYFVYFEEVDLAKRLIARGLSSMFLAESQAYHKGCGTTASIKSTRMLYSMNSRLVYAKKHFGPVGFASAYVATMFIEPCVRMASQLFRRDTQSIREIAAAYRQLWASRATRNSSVGTV